MPMKTISEYGFIRKDDCDLAIKYGGYKWFPLNKPKIDFKGNKFTHILSRDGYLDHVLEPDTRVPNYTTNINDAVGLAMDLNIDLRDLHSEILNRIKAIWTFGKNAYNG